MAEPSLLLTEYVVRGCCSLRDRCTEGQSPNVLSKVVPQEIEHQGPENVCLELIHINSAHVSLATDSLPPVVATGLHSTSLACNHSGTRIFWSLPVPNHLPFPPSSVFGGWYTPSSCSGEVDAFPKAPVSSYAWLLATQRHSARPGIKPAGWQAALGL